MRTLVGRDAIVVRRRHAQIDRLITMRLRRNPFATPPGATRDLWIGERTHYRAAAWLTDLFQRSTLGAGYEDWANTGFDGLTISAGTVVPAAFGVTVDRFETHTHVLPRDQWGQISIRALDPDTGYSTVGVGLRLSPPSGTGRGYLMLAVAADGNPSVARIVRYRAETPETVAETSVPWVIGDTLRATADYATLRIFRNGVLVLEAVDDDPLLVGGRAGIQAIRELTGGTAALSDFCAGPLRQEYTGIALDGGDAAAALGMVEPSASPVTFALRLSGLGKIGGADRFADLIRHGRNTGSNTYDVQRSRVRLNTAFGGASVPIAAAVGLVEEIDQLTEEVVGLQCKGPDGFLTPLITACPVTYVPTAGLPTTPDLPEDPCAVPVPDVITGTPEDPIANVVIEGDGPEAPIDGDDGEEEPEEGEPPGGGAAEPLFYGITLAVYGPPVDPPTQFQISTFKTSDEWDIEIDSSLALDEEWILDEDDPITYRIAYSMLFRNSLWPGTHVTGEDFPGLRLFYTVAFGGGPPVTEPPTAYTFPETRVQVVEYGIANPEFDPELPPSEENPEYRRPDTKEEIETFLAGLTWDEWIAEDPPFLLAVLDEYVFASRSVNGGSIEGQPALINIVEGGPMLGLDGGSADAFGQPIGAARWIALRVPPADRTPPSGFSWFASSISTAQVDFLDFKHTIATPPP